uniref:Uncharacterized protein n=1 Tax=Anguilla anguilla TaxID=7936 RepID=A0A0E9RFE9_ANGAN
MGWTSQTSILIVIDFCHVQMLPLKYLALLAKRVREGERESVHLYTAEGTK